MGCSASRSSTFLTSLSEENPHQPPSSSSSSHSPYYSCSDSSATPVSRTLSLPSPLIHHPPLRKGDTNHLVSLTSTTYGSLVLLDHSPLSNRNPGFSCPTARVSSIVECQSTSNTSGNVNSCGVRNQIRGSSVPTDGDCPSSPDSVINTWELMEGLDDVEFDLVESARKPDCGVSEIDTGSGKKVGDLFESFEFVEHVDSKPLWKHLSEESLLAKMDENVVSSYRQALSSRRLGCKDARYPPCVRQTAFEISIPLINKTGFFLEGVEDRVVLYFTSLRGIRKTYEDCCTVRMILKGFRVFVDERDISMDSEYRNELKGVFKGKAFNLPQVFIRGNCIGGAEEIKQLHEGGDLARLLKGFPAADPGFVCSNCGDVRFVPCPICNGSRKIFEEDEGKSRRCSDCNENGLIRCPNCCS